MTVRLIPRPAPISDADWNLTSRWVEKALRRGKSQEGAESYRASCETENRQLWHLETDGRITGVVITEVYDHPDGKTVALPVTAGTWHGAIIGSGALHHRMVGPGNWSQAPRREWPIWLGACVEVEGLEARTGHHCKGTRLMGHR